MTIACLSLVEKADAHENYVTALCFTDVCVDWVDNDVWLIWDIILRDPHVTCKSMSRSIFYVRTGSRITDVYRSKRNKCLIYIQWPQTNSTSLLLCKKEWTTLMVRFHKQKYVCVCVSLLWASSTSPVGWRLTELEGLRLSWESVSGGNWKSAGRVVFLLLALRADLLLVVAACEEKKLKFLKFWPKSQTYSKWHHLLAEDFICRFCFLFYWI